MMMRVLLIVIMAPSVAYSSIVRGTYTCRQRTFSEDAEDVQPFLTNDRVSRRSLLGAINAYQHQSSQAFRRAGACESMTGFGLIVCYATTETPPPLVLGSTSERLELAFGLGISSISRIWQFSPNRLGWTRKTLTLRERDEGSLIVLLFLS